MNELDIRPDRFASRSDAGGLEAGVGRAFPRTVNTDDRFKEEPIGQLPGLGTEFANRQRPAERASDVRFVLLPNPDQDECWVTRFERLLRRFDNGTIQAVAVRLRRTS